MEETYDIKLSAQEVRNLGESRYLRTRWKRYVIPISVLCLLFILASGAFENNKSIQASLEAIALFGAVGLYALGSYQTSKAGKRFYESVKQK